MGGEEDSALIKLLQGKGGLLWPSSGERWMLKFALDTLGEPLSRFLLSGLGEEEEGRVWLFTVMFTDNNGASYHREIRVEADERPDIVTLLPCRREPLVMLSFLYILISRRPFSAGMLYDQEEILELLGWEDTPSSRLSIDETVERYANLTYRWAMSVEELAEKNISVWQGQARFVSGYSYRDAEEMKERQMKRVSNRIDFSSEFISELMRRSLFEIDWNNVQSLRMEKAY